MKRFYIWISIIFISISLPAYNYLTIFFNDGSKTLSYVLDNIDSLKFSIFDLDGTEYTDWQTQELWIQNTITRHSITSIDSIVFSSSEKSSMSIEDLFYNISLELKNYLRSSVVPNYNDIIGLLSKYDDSVDIQIADSVLIVKMPDNYCIDIDLYGKSTIQDSYWKDYNSQFFDDLIYQLFINLGLSEEKDFFSNDNRLNIGMPKKIKFASPRNNSLSNETIVNRKVLLWALEDIEADYVIKRLDLINAKLNNLGLNGFDLEIKRGKQCTLSSIKDFDKYGIVIVFAHGDKHGELCYPSDYVSKSSLESIFKHKIIIPDDITEYYSLDSNLLKELLPESLSNTIIWTCMCHSFNNESEVYKAFFAKGCPAFTGFKNYAYSDQTIMKFETFAALFFAGLSAKDAFKNSQSFADYYGTFKENLYIDGHLTASPLAPINGQPRASILLPSDHYNNNQHSSPKRYLPLSMPDVPNFGFYFINLKSGNITIKRINEDILTLGERKDYLGLTNLIITGNTDNLDDGQYEYKLFIETNGDTTYSEKSFYLEVDKGFCPDSQHPHKIDLGTNVFWSCCNLDADLPYMNGGYYAWGETCEKEKYDWSTYIYCDGVQYPCFDIGSDISETSYDVARFKWGGDWRMPTMSEVNDLINKCKSEWIYYKGIQGCKLTALNGNSIFLPASGCRWLNGYLDWISDLYYWTSTLSHDNDTGAYNLMFYSGKANLGTVGRSYGLPVRPVCNVSD